LTEAGLANDAASSAGYPSIGRLAAARAGAVWRRSRQFPFWRLDKGRG